MTEREVEVSKRSPRNEHINMPDDGRGVEMREGKG
jgi:hypothetical protein